MDQADGGRESAVFERNSSVPWMGKLGKLGIRECDENVKILKSRPSLLGCKLGTVASR
jgi:hypothetical protein